MSMIATLLNIVVQSRRPLLNNATSRADVGRTGDLESGFGATLRMGKPGAFFGTRKCALDSFWKEVCHEKER